MNAEAQGTIMVVDDQPGNLELLEDILTQQGYAVRTFPRGSTALAAAALDPPDLILLDINMPEINGFEVCKRLKADKKLASIPVIFLSALSETEDKVKAFRSGGVDYVTKPFQFDEVRARVETHLQLQRARRVERDLLEKTLNGAVRSLAELVHLTGPALSTRSEAIRGIVDHLAARLTVEERWQYDLAATLCLIGCISLPVESFERAYMGETASADEEEMFRAHPETGARLLASIPRLGCVSEMIRHQQTAAAIGSAGTAETGACMLRIALELDRQLLRSVPFRSALEKVRGILRGFPKEMLAALEDYSPPTVVFEIKRLQVNELRTLMILEEDVVMKDGSFLILAKGTTLNATLTDRIRNFARVRGIKQPIVVRVIRSERASHPNTFA